MSQPAVTQPEVVRYSDRPELWDSLGDLSSEVWPEYNLHGDVLNQYWDQLYTAFPEWQFVLFDPAAGQVLAEGHTIPVAWDGTDAGLGPGIDGSLADGFALRAAGGTPSALCALAAEIPPLHQGRGLSPVMLRAMAGLAAGAGLAHLIAPVRPNLKERYPTIAIERYAGWTREDGTPFDPETRVLLRTRPSPLTWDQARLLHGARPAGPPSRPSAEPITVQRQVGNTAVIMVAGQKIALARIHAGRIVTVHVAGDTMTIDLGRDDTRLEEQRQASHIAVWMVGEWDGDLGATEVDTDDPSVNMRGRNGFARTSVRPATSSSPCGFDRL